MRIFLRVAARSSEKVPVTAPPKSNFRTMATCDLHLNRPLGPVLNDTTVIPPYPYCQSDSPRWHGPRDVVKRPVLGHGSTCQFGYLHNPEALANLRAHEARTIELMSSWSRCGTSLLDTVEALAEASGGASTSSAPLSCSIVFIGDSHTYQALDAESWELGKNSVLKADQQRQPPPKKDPKPCAAANAASPRSIGNAHHRHKIVEACDPSARLHVVGANSTSMRFFAAFARDVLSPRPSVRNGGIQ